MENKAILFILCVIQINTVLCGNYQTYADLNINYKIYNEQSISAYETRDVPKEEVTFRLWSSIEQTTYIPLITGKVSNIKEIKADKPFKFITHGYLSKASKPWVRAITNAYLAVDDMNVIEVDWSGPAGSVLYPNAAAATKSVGQHLSDLILDLHQQYEIPFESFHLVGHSLGAHVSGFAGKKVTSKTGAVLGRISGLDPAGPLFTDTDSSERLASDDASFVDVIHTDGGKYGYLKALGNVDFYPNGGTAWQPGCYIYGIVEMVACSHVRVCSLWLESIHSDKFVANLCQDKETYNKGLCKNSEIAIMGEHVKKHVEGTYFLNTKAASPFAKNGQI